MHYRVAPLWSVGSVKGGPHQWPTDAATRKYVDRGYDRLQGRIDRLNTQINDLSTELVKWEQFFAKMFPPTVAPVSD